MTKKVHAAAPRGPAVSVNQCVVARQRLQQCGRFRELADLGL
jgi:hypothetical protein